MQRATYPFSAIVNQEEMKLALLLAAIDWRLSVLLRGEKGSGKTTTARALAALLPPPAPFVNLPIGATEDRLIGGLHLERTLKGDPVLRPGLLSEAHGGVLYIDEVNLLPAHLGDMLLDTASSGVNVIEREGLSASHATDFVLLGSMNPEEGTLRPQLLDRFALSVDILAIVNPDERQIVVERRIAFERDPLKFADSWHTEQAVLRDSVSEARERLNSIQCPTEILSHISETICESGVRSLRADLALMRASIAYAALANEHAVGAHHVMTVLPLVLAHRNRSSKPQNRSVELPASQPSPTSTSDTKHELERIFEPRKMETPSIKVVFSGEPAKGSSVPAQRNDQGPAVRSRLSEVPRELDLRSTLNHAVIETGFPEPRVSDLHERIRSPHTGTRYIFAVDSSGSHAAKEQMRLVKGAAEGLLAHSFKKGDEVVLIVFRGTSAKVVLEPTQNMEDVTAALEYLPTGGRTPLAHALEVAKAYLTPTAVLVLLTDGRANIASRGGDPWQEALQAATELRCRALVIDTENAAQPLGLSRTLAEALQARYVSLEGLAESAALDLSNQTFQTMPFADY
jgi:magnesium chelatase subunit D